MKQLLLIVLLLMSSMCVAQSSVTVGGIWLDSLCLEGYLHAVASIPGKAVSVAQIFGTPKRKDYPPQPIKCDVKKIGIK